MARQVVTSKYVPSSGEPWTAAEEDKLRLLFIQLVAQFSTPFRNDAAVRAHLQKLATRHGAFWPERPIVEETGNG